MRPKRHFHAIVRNLLLLLLISPSLSECSDPVPDQETIHAWIRALSDKDFQRRERAVSQLSGAGRPAIVSLVNARPKLDLEARRRADAILLKIDPISASAPTISSADLDERWNALTAVRGFRDARLVDLLLPRLRVEEDYKCLAEIVELLALQKDRRVTKHLTDLIETMVKEYDPKKDFHTSNKRAHVNSVIEHALWAIGAIGDPAAYEALARFYVDRKSAAKKGERYFAQLDYVSTSVALTRALGGTGDPRGVDILLETSTYRYPEAGGFEVARAVHEALIKIGRPAVPLLIQRLQREPLRTHALVVDALGELGDTSAIPVLAMLLDKTPPWFAGHAAVALDQLGSDQGLAWFEARLQKPNNEEKYAVQFALAKCKNPRLRPLCVKILEGDASWCHASAAEALARMGDERGWAYLRGMLNDPNVAARFIETLTDLKDKACTCQFVEMVKHPRQDISNAVMRALAAQRLDALRELVRVRSQKSIETLISMLSDQDERTSTAATQVLWEVIGANLSYDRGWPVTRSTVMDRIQAWWSFHRADYPG